MFRNESAIKGDGRMHLAVFTDLDGSLLDHHAYSFENARPALERLREQRIPLVFITSKTRPEVEMLQAAMGIRDSTWSELLRDSRICSKGEVGLHHPGVR